MYSTLQKATVRRYHHAMHWRLRECRDNFLISLSYLVC